MPGGHGELGEAVTGGLTGGRGFMQPLLVQAQRPLVHLQLLHPSSAIFVSPSAHAGVSEHGPSLAMVNCSFLFRASQAAMSKAHLLPCVTPFESQTGAYSIVQPLGQFSVHGPCLTRERFSFFFRASQAAISKAHLLLCVTPLESQTGLYSIVQMLGQTSSTLMVGGAGWQKG